MKVFIYLTILIFAGIQSVISQSCLPSGITFTTQAQIDAFSTNYPGCTIIIGNVTIDGLTNNAITNLSGLSQLSSVGGGLYVTTNTALTDLTGLNNLNSIGGYLSIATNSGLTSLTGLNNLSSIGGFLRIYNNSNLTSLTGLNNLNSIGGYLEISWNSALTSLTVFNNLTSIGTYLTIHQNNHITSLIGLNNINVTISNLTLTNNVMLNLCEIPPICEYLSIPSNPATIFSNSPNCVIRANVEAACLALPITLLSFQAQPQKTNTHLTWRTASETNNDRFEVEHSRNGVSFEAIGTLAGQGTTTEPHDYAFTHERPGHGTHYYRLRQVDFDGRFSYSDIVSVDIDNHEGLKNVILWPNPTTGIVQLDIKLDEGVSYAVSDALGRMLIQGQLVTPYIDLSALPDGTYTMHLTNAIHVTARRILKASN